LQVAEPIEIFNLLVEPSGKFPIPSGKNKGFRPCPGTGAMQIAPAGFPGHMNGIAIFRCRTTSGSQGKSHQNLPESLEPLDPDQPRNNIVNRIQRSESVLGY